MSLFGVFIFMNKSYSKIRHIQESNIRLEERILIERKPSTDEVDDLKNQKNILSLFHLSSDEVREHLTNIPIETRFIRIKNCGFADFTGIDLCGIPNLTFVNLENTESNFDEQGYECAYNFGKGMYDMDYEKPKEKGFSEPTSSTDIYGKYNYSFK